MEHDSVISSSRFLASTLHEIRTPIQTVISTVELLQDTTLDKEQSEYVRQIEFSANALLELANDVLDYTKINSNEFKLECIPYDVIELTEQIVDLVSIDAFNRGLEVVTNINYSMESMVMGDPNRVKQILLNLIKNAVKFTSDGYIVIRLTHQKNVLLFEVIDSGIGIKSEKKELVFKDFYQVDASTTRKYGGTGLGLSISKNLVKVMKGSIGVRDNPANHGSVFWFTIPFEQATFIPETETINEKAKKAKVLIVDDNPLALRSMHTKLRSLGMHNLCIATSAKKAMEIMNHAKKEGRPVDMVFIDMIMPETDGWSLADQIKSNPNLRDTPLFLMISEGQMDKDAKKKISDLFKDYLYKPIKKHQLLSIIQETFTPLEELKMLKQPVMIPSVAQDVAKGNHILIAEDHPVNRKLLETFLIRFGATVYTAENGEEAVKQIEAHPEIQLIFMDMLMPVKNGIDATAELRSKNYKGIIIACTANNNPDDIKTYTQMGINDILIKPFKKEMIGQILEKWNAVFSVPAGMDIASLTDMNNKAGDLWDIADFMQTTANDKELSIQLMDDYIQQTGDILRKIKAALKEKKADKDFKNLELWAHTLKGSSAALSITRLAATGEVMNQAAKKHDLIALESARTDFAIDFIELKRLVENWKSSL